MNRLEARRFISDEESLILHQLHRVPGAESDVIKNFPHAIFAERPVHDLGRAGPPVLHIQTGLLFKGFFDHVDTIGPKRAVDDCLSPFFFRLFDTLRVLCESRSEDKKCDYQERHRNSEISEHRFCPPLGMHVRYADLLFTPLNSTSPSSHKGNPKFGKKGEMHSSLA